MPNPISNDLYEAIKETAAGLSEVGCEVGTGTRRDGDGKPCLGLFGSEGALQSFAFSFGLAHTDRRGRPDAVYGEFREMLPDGDMAEAGNGHVWFFPGHVPPEGNARPA